GQQARHAHRGLGIEAKLQLAFKLHGRSWGDRWDSNPQQPESQSGTLPLSYGHRSRYCAFLQPRGLACPARLERATYGLEGRCSIRLSYGQLPGAQTTQNIHASASARLVGVGRFELPTSCSQSKRATRLRYTPKKAANDTLSPFCEQLICLLQGGHFCYKARFSFCGQKCPPCSKQINSSQNGLRV